MLKIFSTFFWLGWISFGGPAAHIGYFRQTFVEKLKWLDDREYAQIVALSQFLPGPGSSQVGFAVGYKHGGLSGACAAFFGFTLPSVFVMVALAILSSQITDSPLYHNVIHGLKLLAVVVVADATWGMYKNFCTNKISVTLALITAISLLIIPSIMTQMVVLLVAALLGIKYLGKPETRPDTPFKPGIMPLAIFAILLFIVPLFTTDAPAMDLFNSFFQAGSLVFGGGHVVLPLLQNLVGDQLSQDTFLTGYAAAQAVPGPMFTFATYIGYSLMPSAPISGAFIATIAVFLPGFLLLLGVLKNWQSLAQKTAISGAVSGVNASVVGLLASALYQPVFNSAVVNSIDIALVLIGFYLLKHLKLPIIVIVGFYIATGIIVGL